MEKLKKKVGNIFGFQVIWKIQMTLIGKTGKMGEDAEVDLKGMSFCRIWENWKKFMNFEAILDWINFVLDYLMFNLTF